MANKLLNFLKRELKKTEKREVEIKASAGSLIGLATIACRINTLKQAITYGEKK